MKKIEFLLSENMVKEIYKKHKSQAMEIVSEIKNSVQYILKDPFKKNEDFTKDKILKYLNINVKDKDINYYSDLGKYDANKSINLFISKGGYHAQIRELSFQYGKKAEHSVRVLDPMIEGLKQKEFTYELDKIFIDHEGRIFKDNSEIIENEDTSSINILKWLCSFCIPQGNSEFNDFITYDSSAIELHSDSIIM